MQLATPFLIISATDISQRISKKSIPAKVIDSNDVLANDQTVDQGIQQSVQEAKTDAPSELVHQNLAILLASCGDCV